MAWAKQTDTLNSSPEIMRAHELAAERGDDRLVMELQGAINALYNYSAQQWTDYWVPRGAAVNLLGVSRANPIISDLMTIGVVVDIVTEPENKLKLLERENFIHLIKSTEKADAQKRRADRRRGSLQVPVLLRDGDNCRYCGTTVIWDNDKADEAIEFDHRDFKAETTPDNYVVSCRECNQVRRHFGDRADIEIPLLDPPEMPTYGPHLLKKLATWPQIVKAVSKTMRIPNPLERGKVESQQPIQQPVEDTASSPTSNPSSPAPPAHQAGREQQFPQDSRKVEDRGRAANETTRPASSRDTNRNPFTPDSPEPTDNQPVREPQGDQGEHVRSPRPANENQPTDARKRRRRRRR